MIAQSAEAAVESAGPTSIEEPAEQQPPAGSEATPPNNEKPELFGTRLGELLSGIEMPEEIRTKELEADKRKSEAKEQKPPGQPAKKPDAEEQPAPAAAAEDDDKALPDEWPESARAQVLAERKKRQRRTEELTQANERAQNAESKVKELEDQLQGQPSQAQVAPTTPGQDPTARIFNFNELQKTATHFQQEKRDQEELLDFTARYPRGVEDVLLGHDKAGKEIRQSYTEDKIAEMRVGAQQKLRGLEEALKPGGSLQRRGAYLQERSQFDPLARKLYTDKERTAAGLPAIGASLVFDDKGQLTEEAKTIMSHLPGITQHSDVLLNVGRYLRGLRIEQQEMQQLAKKNGNGNGANGNANLPEHLKPFARPTPPIAPSAPAARTPGAPAGGRARGDVEKAEQRVIETGGADEGAIDALFEASLNSSSAERERAPA